MSVFSFCGKAILTAFAGVFVIWGVVFSVVAVVVFARALARVLTGQPRRPPDGKPLTREEKRVLRALRRDLRRQDAYAPAYDTRRQPLWHG